MLPVMGALPSGPWFRPAGCERFQDSELFCGVLSRLSVEGVKLPFAAAYGVSVYLCL